ncbi:MAG: hypothetical protein NTY88_00445 [Bacteroidetes bacterium]|nr:hypothetical protein [Bacteroidota bacterium]
MKRIFFFLFGCLILCYYGCDKKKSDSTAITSYPLQAGNIWVYDVTYHHDSVTTNYTYTFRCVGDTTINGITCSQLIKTEANLNTGASQTFSHYYKNQSDGFYFIAGDSLTDDMLYFKNELALFPKLAFKTESTSRGIFVADPPLKLLSFPTNQNDSWISNEYGSQSHFGRKYLGYENTLASAGTFYCIKVQPYFDNDHNGIADSSITNYQWFGNKGLVKETSKQVVTDFSGAIFIIEHSANLRSINF